MPQKNHPLNIWALHKLLKQCNLGKRDFLWTQYVSINNEKVFKIINWLFSNYKRCVLYTSDADDEEDSVELGGRRTVMKNQHI